MVGKLCDRLSQVKPTPAKSKSPKVSFHDCGGFLVICESFAFALLPRLPPFWSRSGVECRGECGDIVQLGGNCAFFGSVYRLHLAFLDTKASPEFLLLAFIGHISAVEA